MTRHLLFVLLAGILACFTHGAPAQEQKTAGDKAAVPAIPDEMMKKWQEAMTPGDGHKRLERMTGSWDATIRSWWQGPGAAPAESKGSADIRWILGGRFLNMDYRGEMMGMPFQGIGTLGYDNFNKKYVMSWIDNMGTALSVSEGTADKSGTVVTLFGKMDDPMTGEHGKTAKYIYRLTDMDRHVLEIHDFAYPEPDTKVVEIIYTRKKN